MKKILGNIMRGVVVTLTVASMTGCCWLCDCDKKDCSKPCCHERGLNASVGAHAGTSGVGAHAGIDRK